MEKFHRGVRRHHRQRLFKKRLRQFTYNTPFRLSWERTRDRTNWEFWSTVRVLNTPAFCTCQFCRNPRKDRGNGAGGVSWQEWKRTVADRADHRFAVE